MGPASRLKETVKMYNYEMHRSNLFPRLTLVNEWLLSLVMASMKWILPPLQVSALVYQRRQWHPTPGLLPGKSHGWRSLVGCSPWARWELDTIEWLHFHFSLSCIGEGNGTPLQCSCLENPRDGGAWWAAVYWVTQSRTQLKQFSSSSSRPLSRYLFWFLLEL